MDSCFLCLNNTREKPCTHCSIRAHPKCWVKYIKNIYGKQELICPVCKNSVVYRQSATRSVTKRRKKMEKVNTVKQFLDDIESTNASNTRLERMRISRELFNYLYDNMDFVYSIPQFEITVRNKMIELGNKEKWRHMNVMYMKMFREKLPKEYF